MSVKKYRKKPVEIEAVQFVEGAHVAAMEWIISNGGRAGIKFVTNHVVVHTLEGRMEATPGDFIIKGVQGEFYPCKPDIFAETYEEVI